MNSSSIMDKSPKGDLIKIKEEVDAACYDINVNLNTKKSTQTWMKIYHSWAIWHGKKTRPEEYPPVELNEVLGKFYCEVRRNNGEDYEPDSLRLMRSGLHRYLAEKKYPKSIISDDEFKSSQHALDDKIRRLKMAGRGKNKTLNVFTQDIEERLWQAGKLGYSSPITLIRTMWYIVTKYFGLRGRENHVALTMNNFKRHVDENGIPYIQLGELPSAMDQYALHYHNRVANAIGRMTATGGIRCPVSLFEFYVSKRPDIIKSTGRFYLNPAHKLWNGSSEWFKRCPLGKNTFSRLLRDILDPELVNQPDATSSNPPESDINEDYNPSHGESHVKSPLCPVVERLNVGENSEYAFIKIPRLNTQDKTNRDCVTSSASGHMLSLVDSPSVVSSFDDGTQLPRISNVFASLPSTPALRKTFYPTSSQRAYGTQLPEVSNIFTATLPLVSPRRARTNSNRPRAPDSEKRGEECDSNSSRGEENVFTHVDENGSINIFYNCNVTFVPTKTKSRKRKRYESGSSSSEY